MNRGPSLVDSPPGRVAAGFAFAGPSHTIYPGKIRPSLAWAASDSLAHACPSRVGFHGELFFGDNADSMIKALRSAFYNPDLPEQLLVDNGSIYCYQKATLICARVGCRRRSAIVALLNPPR